jgi:hypothetical protein
MPDANQIRALIAEQQQRMERAEGRVAAAIDAVRMRTLVWDVPEDLDPVIIEAAVADLRQARADWIAARDQREKLKAALGL